VNVDRWQRRNRQGRSDFDPVWLRQYLTEEFRELLAGTIERCLADKPAETSMMLDDVVDFYLTERAAGRVPYSIPSSTGMQQFRDAFLQCWLVGFPDRMQAREAAALGPGVPPME
jgi:hypothetical protein